MIRSPVIDTNDVITEDRATGESFFSRFSLAKLGERGTDYKMKQRGRDRKQTISIGSKLDTFAEQDKPHVRGEISLST